MYLWLAECFLQMKSPNVTRPTQYPFCFVFCLMLIMYVCTHSVLGAQLFFSKCPVAKHIVGLLNGDGDRCPYCKMANYSVEYRGPKSMEEKGVEQVVCL
jgi:hypothetical protein